MPGPVSEAAKLPDLKCMFRGCRYDAEHSYWKDNDWLQLCDKHDRLVRNTIFKRGFLLGSVHSNSVKGCEQGIENFAKQPAETRLAAVLTTMDNLLVMINEPILSKQEKDALLAEIRRTLPAIDDRARYE